MLNVLTIIILVYLIYIFREINNKENYTPDGKVSVCILSYNRPHNLQKCVNKLSKYKNVGEILIFHGNPNTYREISLQGSEKKIKNFKDFQNNNLYGAGRRFLHYVNCKYDMIILLDDDLLPSEDWLNTSIETAKKNNNKETIYGSYRRTCSKNGYGTKPDDKGVILTGCCLLMKSSLEKFFNRGHFNKCSPWFFKYKGNCEDLIFNLYVKNVLKNEPIYIDKEIYELDTENGYSSNGEHYKLRDKFCRNFYNYNFDEKIKIL
jgi:hypothetical protein